MRGLKSEIISIGVRLTSSALPVNDIDDFTEAQTRQAFLNTLTIDVVNILTALKVGPHSAALVG